jgi:hypothetical protein
MTLLPPPPASPPPPTPEGEQFSESNEVNGVAANVRRNQDRIELWTRTSGDEAAQVKVR